MVEQENVNEKKGSGLGKKLGLGCLGLFILAIIVTAAGEGGRQTKKEETTTPQTQESKEEAKPSTTTEEYRFKDRSDSQPKDIELVVGESAELDGLKVSFTNAQRTTALSEYSKADSGKEFVIITASFENVSDRTQSYNSLDFRVQTAEGQVLDHHWFNPRDDDLESGDLVTGGKVTGTIVFEVPKEEGHQYILYKPNAWKPDRIVVQIQ